MLVELELESPLTAGMVGQVADVQAVDPLSDLKDKMRNDAVDTLRLDERFLGTAPFDPHQNTRQRHHAHYSKVRNVLVHWAMMDAARAWRATAKTGER